MTLDLTMTAPGNEAHPQKSLIWATFFYVFLNPILCLISEGAYVTEQFLRKKHILTVAQIMLLIL